MTIEYHNGRMHLSAEERAYWLEKFGDSKLLELALLRLSGEAWQFKRYPEKARSYLARLAMGKVERDVRFLPPKSKAIPANLGRGPTDGSKRYVEGSIEFAIILARMQKNDPAEARAMQRRGWVWVHPARVER